MAWHETDEAEMIICITGTPGTGKTYIARKLQRQLICQYLDLNKLILKNRLYHTYDKKDKTFDVDINELCRTVNIENSKIDSLLNKKLSKLKGSSIETADLMKYLIGVSGKNTIIIDSHLSHYLYADYCIVVKTDIKKLHSRLKKRGYSKKKITDNIESEIFEICLNEARAEKHKVITVFN